MEKENSKSNLMTEGKIWKNILFFSIPLILGNLLQQLYNTADSIIVGNFVGSKALAAVGSSTSLIYLLIAFSQGASVGAGVIVAQFLGAKDKKATQDAVHTAFFIAIILGVVLTIGGVIFTPSILRLYSCGLIFNVVYNMSAGILNAAGNSKRSLIYLAYASVTNIILDIILISFLKMGVAGAAIATDISQVVSCILALIFLMKSNDSYKVDLKKIKCHSKMAIRIIKIGLPTGIQNMVISFSNILVQASINSFGALAMAGFGAYMKIDGFNILPVMSFSMAVTTFVGQNYGAGKIDRVKKGMWTTIGMGMIYTVVTGALILLFSNEIMRLFTEDKDVIAYGRMAIMFFCPFYFILSILQSLAGTVRGTGKSVPPMVVLLVSMCLFRIVWVQFILPMFNSIDGIFILYPVSWALGTVLMILYAWKGKWLEVYK